MSERKNGANRLIAAIRQLAALGLTVNQIGDRLGRHHATIAKYAADHDVAVVSSDQARRDKLRTIQQMAAEGGTLPEMARKLRLSQDAVRQLAHRNGIEIRRQTKEEVAARAAPRGRQGVLRCPPGIPADLQDEYRDFARELGPQMALRAVKRLMEGGL